jgi:hypothetical protein
MKLTGHKTKSVCPRYAIGFESDVALGAGRFAALASSTEPGPRRVMPLRETGVGELAQF